MNSKKNKNLYNVSDVISMIGSIRYSWLLWTIMLHIRREEFYPMFDGQCNGKGIAAEEHRAASTSANRC